MTSKYRPVTTLACMAGLLASSVVLGAQPQPGLSYGANLKLTAQSIDDLDLGTRDGGDFNGVGLSVRPWIFNRQGDWSTFALGEAFLATDTIESDTSESDTFDPNDAREREDQFLAMHEFWVDYGGLSAYPGESLRLGRQKIRSADGLWWDSNIEALRWNFETTLLSAHVGIAERFSDYRTDLDELAPEDEDRLHLLADLSWQWQPGHWAGLKLHHSDDRGNLPGNGASVDQLSKTATGELSWLGAELNGDFYNERSNLPLSYWVAATWLTGNVDTLRTSTVAGRRQADGQLSQDVDAWAVDLGLRWNIDQNWRVGTTYMRASGGSDGDDSEQFTQTGLESNRSKFTGTGSAINRFGEAYRGEMNNLQAASVFSGWQLGEDYDASLVYHRFWRVDDQADSSSGLKAQLVPGEKDIGQEVDLVVTRYLNRGQIPAGMEWLKASSALVRFRGGLFLPGDAFGKGTDSSMHRAFVDFVWRY